MESILETLPDGITILKVDGAINDDNASELTDELADRIDNGLTSLIVDCSKLTSISSMGLSTLLLLHNRMRRRGGQMKITNLQGQTREVVKLTRLDEVLDVHDDLQEARKSFSGQPSTPPGT